MERIFVGAYPTHRRLSTIMGREHRKKYLKPGADCVTKMANHCKHEMQDSIYQKLYLQSRQVVLVSEGQQARGVVARLDALGLVGVDEAQ